MTSLADLLDPDQWIVSGKNLSDFPWPEGTDEREAIKLILSERSARELRDGRERRRMPRTLHGNAGAPDEDQVDQV